MPLEKFRLMVDQLGGELIFIALWNYGEPLLNEDMGKMIRHCSQKGIISILSSNASLLDEEKSFELIDAGLNYLIVSVDGITDDVYREYRGGGKLSDLEKRVKRVCDLKREKRSAFPVVELQFIVMEGNEHQANEFFDWAQSLGVDRASLKKFSMLRRTGSGQAMMPLNEGYRLGGALNNEGFLRKFCSVPWQAMVVNADGNVVPCCSDYFSSCVMGNGFAEDVQKIWSNDKYGVFRQRIKKDIDSLGICLDCPHHSGHSGSFIAARQFR